MQTFVKKISIIFLTHFVILHLKNIIGKILFFGCFKFQQLASILTKSK